MLYERVPLVLYSPSSLIHLGQCDCDCACVADVPPVPPAWHGDGLWVQQAGVTPFPVQDGWQVSFNPAGPVGVIALNSRAQAVLDQFARPRGLDAGALPPLAPALAQEVLDSLVRTGLVRPAAPVPDRSVPAATLSAWLHIAEACNLRCPYCYVPKSPRLATADTAQHIVDRLIGLAVRHGYRSLQLKYAGGEPTLNLPVVCATHRYAARAAAEAGLQLKEVLLTNGVDVTDAMLDAIADAQMKLMVSLDGGPAAHAQTRARPGGLHTYDSVVSTVDRAMARGLHVDISITLTALNLQGVPGAVAFALGRSLPFSLNFYRECHTEQTLAQLRPDPELLIDVIHRVLELIAAEPDYPLPLTGILDRTRLDVPHCRPCSAGRDYLAIDPDGQIAACQMLLDHPWATLDSDDPLKTIRRRGAGTFRSVEEYQDCGKCQWRTACSGGCPLLRGTSLHRSYCRVYQAILPELVRLEGKRLIALAQQAGS